MATQEAELASRLVAFLRHLETRDHNEIQREVAGWLAKAEGLRASTEYPAPYANRNGRIDFRAQGRGVLVVGEVDRTWIREKSILKCQAHPRALKVFILRDCRDPHKTRQRLRHLPRHIAYDIVTDHVISTDLHLQLAPVPAIPRPAPTWRPAPPARSSWLSRLRALFRRQPR